MAVALLIWQDDLNTGVEVIDHQHMRIVEMLNHLHVAQKSLEQVAVAEVIDELVDYTMSHFAFEEALIENAGYLFAGPHKKVHELFTRKVAEMQSRFDAGEDVTRELHGMLSRWLFNHIRNEDHGYIDSVKAYQRMSANNGIAERDKLKAEVIAQLREERGRRKGWLARLLGL